jgi:hypothetical protein
MCLYCMYVYVSYVYVCIVAAGTRITAASPNDRLLRRHPAGLTQGIPGHGRKHFFPPSLYPLTTRFRAPPPSSPVGGPWTAPPVRLVGVPGQIRACRPGPKPHPSLLGKFRRSLRHTASATAPQRPLPTVIGACMYVPVCACICMYCMYMYVYVCIVCMCVYLTKGNKYPQISPSVRATVGFWIYWPMSLWRRAFESQNYLRSFAGIWFPFWQHIAGHQVLAWATFSLLRLEQNRKKNTYTYIQIQAYTSRFKQIHAYTRWY